MKKLWLLFGPGGIGRGLLAPIAHQSGHKIIFATPNRKTFQFLEKNRDYKVIFYPPGSNDKEEKVIENYEAVLTDNSKYLSIICTLKELKIISTSVRVDNLEAVAKVLAPVLKNRKDKLIILVCENAENNGDKFKKLLEKEIKGITKNLIIPNISVDCMIPPHPSDTRTIEREKFGQLVIEKPKDRQTASYLKKLPNVNLINGKIDRHYKKKIIGVSGLHAGIAWLGLNKGYQYVYQAANDPKLKEIIKRLIRELAIAIFEETKFPKNEILKYLNLAKIRVSNPHLKDPNERFFRNLRNKLNENERFLGPALRVWQKGIEPIALLKILGIGFKKLIQEEKIKNIEKVVAEISGLPKEAKELENKIIDIVKK